jgi:hypothetical protein
MVQKGKKVKRYKRYRFTDGDMTVKKNLFFGFTAWGICIRSAMLIVENF